MIDPGPNFPAVIRRGTDDVSEALTAAEYRAFTIMDSLDAETKERLYGLLEQ